VNQISTFKTLVVFARIATTRTLNTCFLFKFPSLKKQAAETGEPKPRAATIHRSQKTSFASRLPGLALTAMMTCGLFLLLFCTMFTLLNAVLLDEMQSAAVLRISAAKYEELAKASQIAEKSERETKIDDVLRSEFDCSASWLATASRALAKERFEQHGLQAFEAIPADTTWGGPLAYLSEAGRARALRVLGAFLALVNVSLVCMACGLVSKNLAGADPSLVFFWQFPIPRHVLYSARLIEYSIDTFIAPIATPFFAAVLWLCGMPFWSGLGLGTVLGVSTAVTAAALRLAAEVTMIQFLSRKLRGVMVAMASTFGGMATLVVMLCSNSQTVVQGFLHLTNYVPQWKYWTPLSGGVGTDAMTSMTSLTWMLVAPATTIVLSILAVALATRLTRTGLACGQDSVRGSRKATLVEGKASRWSAAVWKELLQIRRQPELLSQILAAPLSIAFIGWIGGYQRTIDAVTSSGANIMAAIVGAGAYMLVVAATQTLAREFKMLWILQSQPRPLADIVRSKSRVWAAMTLLLTLPLAAWAMIVMPGEAPAILIRLPFLATILWLLAELTFGLTALSASVISAEQIRFRRTTLLLPMLLTMNAASAVLSQNWWLQLSVLAAMLVLNAAVRERQLVELAWLSEPVETPPKGVYAMHGVLAVIGFQTLQNLLLTVLTLTKQFTPNATNSLAYCMSAVVTALTCWIWLHANKLSLPVPKLRGPVTKPLVLGLSLSCVAGFAVTWVRNFVEAGCHIPARIGGGVTIESVYDKWYLLALFVVAAPLFEEWIFRGWMFRSLRRTWSVGLSVAVTALLFASLHPVIGCVALVTLGATTALAAEKTGRLWPSIAIHAGYNFMIWALCVM